LTKTRSEHGGNRFGGKVREMLIFMAEEMCVESDNEKRGVDMRGEGEGEGERERERDREREREVFACEGVRR
jgi:hypothetical protein